MEVVSFKRSFKVKYAVGNKTGFEVGVRVIVYFCLLSLTS
jgi:hypothetical protein